MEAVDFPKTGKPPEMMTFRWTEPEQPGQPMIPPERAERAPDYMDKSHEPCYVSTRLNGQLYRYNYHFASQLRKFLHIFDYNFPMNEVRYINFGIIQ